MIDVGLLHQLQELARIGRQRFHIAALALGIDRVESERGFAGAGQPGHHRQRIARNFDIDVLEIVLAGATDGDVLQHGLSVSAKRALWRAGFAPATTVPVMIPRGFRVAEKPLRTGLFGDGTPKAQSLGIARNITGTFGSGNEP